jgi:DNA-binding GntR family transcriptional regulator
VEVAVVNEREPTRQLVEQPPNHRFRGSTVYDALKTAILSGELPPGEPLVEATLATLCNTSRTPIREALSRLQQDGLVYRSDRGMMVKARDAGEILDLYEVRIILEASAARIASERRTAHEIAAMRRLLKLGEDVNERRAMVEVNRRVHTAIWLAAHNEPLRDLLERIGLHLGRYPETTLTYPGRWQRAHEQHVGLVDAIEARDATRAHDIALQHFSEARDIRLLLQDSEDLDLAPGI